MDMKSKASKAARYSLIKSLKQESPFYLRPLIEKREENKLLDGLSIVYRLDKTR